ncbi:hypothetical protein [Streptomonospora salina]|uniref:Uncharacterized protein n=1 Tax=Streptomonospora salina TaxID=104205 RepID=A0A841E6M9_9ACTN|nr:hypothetical protein [Streptomonospora salina]
MPARPRPPEPSPGAPPPDAPEPQPQPSGPPEPAPGPAPPEPDPDLQPEEPAAPDTPAGPDPEGGAAGGECGMMEVSCHVTAWFGDLVAGALNPLFGWIAGIAFRVPQPGHGVEGLWSGVLVTTNLLFVLLVAAGGAVLMARETAQTRYGLGEILGRLAFAGVAANSSLWIARELFRAANGTAEAVGAMGIDTGEAVANLRDRAEWVLAEGVVFTVLLLVALVVMLVVWVVTDVVRVVMSIVLVIAAPLLLAFHALPQTNRLAALWWRSMAGLCAMPVLQSLAFIAMMRLFFEGQFALFGHVNGTVSPGEQVPEGENNLLYDLIMFLVLVYVQIRIPFWVMKLVWSPHPGASPIMGAAKVVAMMVLYRSLRGLRLSKSEPFSASAAPPRRPSPGTVVPARRPSTMASAASDSGPGRSAGTVAPVQPDAWWYRDRPARPAGELSGGRRELPPPGPGSDGPGPRPLPPQPPEAGPRRLPGPRPLPGPPPARPHPDNPARAAVGDGGFPRRPRTEQKHLFRPQPPATPPETGSAPPQRRWRQGVLPTPPPERAPGRRTAPRVGELLDAREPIPQRRVRGQLSLFANPKKRWVQRGLPLPGLPRRRK